MDFLCIKHVPFEGPAALADWTESRGHRLTLAEVYLGESLPGFDSFDGLFILGGPMNVDEHQAHPWLAPEKAFIRDAIASGKPVVGICLGAQLIAAALGAPVTRAEHTVIGWFDIERAASCPTGLPLPERLRVFHWHGDTYALPSGATRIASSAGCAQEGFLHGERVLAWQCHLETTPQSLAALASACPGEITQGPFILSEETMRSEPAETYQRMHAVLFQILDSLHPRPRPRP